MRGSDTNRQVVDEADEEDQRSNAQGGYDSDGQQDHGEQPNDDQGAVYGESTRQTESDGDEYDANPPSPGQLSRTQSDPTPMPTEEDRDRADAAYKPEVVMLPDDSPEAKLTATLDSGCEDNWITWQKMSEELGMTGGSPVIRPVLRRRHVLHSNAYPLDFSNSIQAPKTLPGKLSSSSFTDFLGDDVSPLGMVDIRFRASGSGKSDSAWFYVLDNENAPFDVLFGSVWMEENDGPDFFKKPVLINAGKPLSSAEQARKASGVRGTSAFAQQNVQGEAEEGEESEPGISSQTVGGTEETVADEPVAVEQPHTSSRWGSKLSHSFSKLHTRA